MCLLKIDIGQCCECIEDYAHYMRIRPIGLHAGKIPVINLETGEEKEFDEKAELFYPVEIKGVVQQS